MYNVYTGINKQSILKWINSCGININASGFFSKLVFFVFWIKYKK